MFDKTESPGTRGLSPSDSAPFDLEERERRAAKNVIFWLVVSPLLLLILILLLFFQPEDQVAVTRHENGYLATRSHHIMGPDGNPLLQGEHEAWYIDGSRAEEGSYERGERNGSWRFWNSAGDLLPDLSGEYAAGVRVSGLNEAP